jgi:putative heme-binding domain-containing protein
MVSGTGEAPSGIVCYESDGFPADYIGTLLVGSWGDHRIDKFVLKPRGISFESIPQPVIKGDDNFRPVGLAVAPDGSMYVTDWVSKEYKLHGKGRIWRISAKDAPKRVISSFEDILSEASSEKLGKLLESPVLNVRRLAAKRLSSSENGIAWSGPTDRRFYELFMFIPVRQHPKEMSGWFENIELSDPFELVEEINWIASLNTSADSLMQLLEHTRSLNQSVPDQNRVRELELRQIAILLGARAKFPKDPSFAQVALRDPLPSIRRLAVQWVGEEKLAPLRPDVEKILASEPMTNELFMACLASLSLLDGVAPAVFEKTPPSDYILAIVNDAARPASLRATALRMLSPSQKELDARRLGEMLASKDFGLQRETVRTLQHSPIPERNELLKPIAANASLDVNLRADAVAGLAGVNPHAKLDDSTRALLIKLATSEKNLGVRLEAIRSLRGSALTGQHHSADAQVASTLIQVKASLAKESDDVRNKLSQAIDFLIGSRRTVSANQALADIVATSPGSANADSVESGRRAFFHVNGAGCYKCHMVGGRGGQVGPDLTVIARTMDRKKLAESIVEPSKEISPQFTTWAIETTSGKVLTGMLLGEEVNGDLRLGNNQGEVFFVPFKEIESRNPLKTSIMPEKLYESMTADEFHDLIAFLETLK